MSSFLVKYPRFLKWLYPDRLSRIEEEEKAIYLTFDDGPIPGITPWILNLLKGYNAKASFFCIGENIKKHPAIYREILDEGHSTGNHTYNHLNGWKISVSNYVDNTLGAEKIMLERQPDLRSSSPVLPSRKLFRPPYGKIKSAQAHALSKLGYVIVVWDVLSGDFDAKISAEKCFQNVIRNTEDGSIIVFHDSLKAEKNLKKVLPEVLEFYQQKGFVFRAL